MVILYTIVIYILYILLCNNDTHTQEEWVPVLKSNDIAAGDLVPIEVDGLAILIAADLDGKIFAIANSCPHLGTPLENGRLGEGSTIVCPLHKSAFSLESGMNIYTINVLLLHH
jgi:nitrite reductase/ring-hydroxylating ferredoxin subunit